MDDDKRETLIYLGILIPILALLFFLFIYAAVYFKQEPQEFLRTAVALVFIVVAFAIYGFPTIVAEARDHHQTLAIFVLNLFLGWTLLGWVLALVWACTAVRREP